MREHPHKIENILASFIAEGGTRLPELPLPIHVRRAKAYDPGGTHATLANRFLDIAFWIR